MTSQRPKLFILSLWTMALIGLMSPFAQSENCGDWLSSQSDFTLNSDQRTVKFTQQEVQLSAMEFLLFKELIQANGAPVDFFDFSSLALEAAENAGKDEYNLQYSRNWMAQLVIRLKRRFEEAFGLSFSERILNFRRRGFAWQPSWLIEKSKTFPSDKITYLPLQNRVYIGSQELRLNATNWALLHPFLIEPDKKISIYELEREREKIIGDEINPNHFRIHISRLNALLKIHLPQSYKGPVIRSEGREGFRQIDHNLIQIVRP